MKKIGREGQRLQDKRGRRRQGEEDKYNCTKKDNGDRCHVIPHEKETERTKPPAAAGFVAIVPAALI